MSLSIQHNRVCAQARYVLIVLTAISAAALAGDPPCEAEWDAAVGSPGLDGDVRAMVVADLGDGPRLFVSGFFLNAAGMPALRIAMWDGQNWSDVGGGVNNVTHSLAVHDFGAGPRLFAGGVFTTAGFFSTLRIAQWDGENWGQLGVGLGPNGTTVRALCVHDDGAGPALYAGGNFTTAGGAAASRIARWNGAAWSTLGSGVGPSQSAVLSLATLALPGESERLYAGGIFANAGGAPALNVAMWDGQNWEPLGAGLSGDVLALCAHDDGAGPALYAAGLFTASGATPLARVAKWDGQAWSPLGLGLPEALAEPRSLLSFDDGSGPALYLGGFFRTAGEVMSPGLARWADGQWSMVGPPLAAASGAVPRVAALAAGSVGAGEAAARPTLWAAGLIAQAGDASVQNIVAWRGCESEKSGPGGPAADLNGDGIVNAADLSQLLGSWGVCPAQPQPCIGDLNGDGVVNAVDLSALLGSWTTGSGG